MSAERLIGARPYGALELKRSYQRGLTWALAVATILNLGALLGIRLYSNLTFESVPVSPVDPSPSKAQFEVLSLESVWPHYLKEKKNPPDACEGPFPGPEDLVTCSQVPVSVRRVAPEYPDRARRNGLEGTVLVRLLVCKHGAVKEVLVVKSSGTNVGFEEAVVAACRQWTFKPAKQDWKPVSIWVNYPVTFSIR